MNLNHTTNIISTLSDKFHNYHYTVPIIHAPIHRIIAIVVTSANAHTQKIIIIDGHRATVTSVSAETVRGAGIIITKNVYFPSVNR